PIWQNIYGLKRDEEAFSVEYISDGTIAVSGWTNQLSALGVKDAFLFKTDLAGNLLFSRAYGGPNDDIGYSVKESVSIAGVGGELIMAGAFGINAALPFDDRDIYTVRTNPAGLAPCAKNPKFRELPVLPAFNTFILPANNTAFNNNLAPADPFVPFTQQNRCCTCADMVVSFTYSPSIFCSGTVVNFANTSTCVDNFRWLVNGVLVGSTANLSYVFATPGIYTVTLQGNNAGCVALSFSQTILVSCGPAPRLEDEASLNALQLSPNPAITQVTLQAELGEGATESAQVLVMDMTGRVVYTQNHPVDDQRLNLQIATADWVEGIYLVQVQSGTFEQTQRLMIAH
ncbi:MAG: T9SS type A sorting domain-containing protein, partial [Bacteroidetes bacterium]|nr:T9SS type A sorting domain-containing protein [Bacteroidota bacterium]